MSNEQNSDEICEKDNNKPPLLSIVLPRRKNIRTTRVDWTIVEPELPVDILLVTVKDYEFVSCYHYLNGTKRSWCHGLGIVDFGAFGDGKVKVALISCEKGSTEAGGSLLTVKKAVETLGPKAVVCVGYCGSLDPSKAKLGDVVISSKLATYSNKKIAEDGREELRGIKVKASRNMGHLIPYAADDWSPPLEESSDFDVDVHREYVMLSGPELVNNRARREQLLSHYPDAIAIEMEGEGLYAVAFDLGIEWVVVKGVSDFADGSKSATEDWQPFASAMAASVVYNMFKYYDVIQQWPHYHRNPVQGAMSMAVTPSVNNSLMPSIPIDHFLRSIAGTTKGKKVYNGRTIEYSVSGRIHSRRELWVYDGTARDVETGEIVKKKHFKTADWAIDGAILELIKRLKERKIITD